VGLYEMYRQQEKWDKGLPPTLIASIKHLRDDFGEVHRIYGRLTKTLCYHRLHPEEPSDISEYLRPLEQLKQWLGLAASQRFVALLNAGTAPTIFKAFLDLYLEGITNSALMILDDLAAIGKANENLLGSPHLEWAEAQAKNMIRSEMTKIEIWVRNVCDKQPVDSNDDTDEPFFWRKWQAPKLIVMTPSRDSPYEPSAIWERFDAVRSRELLEKFAEHYVLHVEMLVERVIGQAKVELAKQPKPAPVAPAPPQKTEEKARGAALTPREARRKSTHAKYALWQRAYLELKKAHPGKSDVWRSQKIARMDIAKGANPETIRKNMTQK
jgi:hypothetical protein